MIAFKHETQSSINMSFISPSVNIYIFNFLFITLTFGNLTFYSPRFRIFGLIKGTKNIFMSGMNGNREIENTQKCHGFKASFIHWSKFSSVKTFCS